MLPINEPVDSKISHDNHTRQLNLFSLELQRLSRIIGSQHHPPEGNFPWETMTFFFERRKNHPTKF